MRTKLLLMLLAVGLASGVASANMLVNPSFEEGAFEVNVTPDYWVHWYTSVAPIHTWMSGGAHLGSKYMRMYNWTSGAYSAYLGQSVPGVAQGSNYAFAVWAKNDAKGQTNRAGVWVDWYDTSNGWISADSAEVAVTSDAWTHITFGAFTAPEGATAAEFWLTAPTINALEPICYDDAIMVCIDGISPEYGTVVPPGEVDLSWTNLDPNSPGESVWVDVWFGTDPNKLTSDPLKYEKVVDAVQDATSVTVEASEEGIYYWQVDSYIYGDPAVVLYDIDGTVPDGYPVIERYFFKFYATDDSPPSVDAGVDMITWSGEPVALDATVVDDGVSDLTYSWSSETPSGTDVSFSATDIEDPTVTITREPGMIPIDNAGFENPEYGDGGWGWNHPDWEVFSDGVGGGGCGIWNPALHGPFAGFGGVAPEGENIAWTYNEATSGFFGLAQVLPQTFDAETEYTLSVYVGNFKGYDFEGYKVQLLVGGNLLVEDDNSLTVKPDTYEFSTVAYTYDPEDIDRVGKPLEIRLLSAPGEACWDDVRLIADPPPPSLSGIPITLTLEAMDESIVPPPHKDTMTIDVYDTACSAARIGLSLAAENPGDIVSDSDSRPDCVTNIYDLAEMALKWLDTSPEEAFTNPVQLSAPNGEFLIFKPETDYAVLATLPESSYASGVGDNLEVLGAGVAYYDDGTSGGYIDCPGWTLIQGTNDLVPNGVDGSVGLNAFAAWGGDTRVESEPLGTIAGDRTYMLSAMVSGPVAGGPLAFELWAGGVALTPNYSVDPTSSDVGDWQDISRTYEPNAVVGHIGEPMTIVIGVKDENNLDDRVVFDNVALGNDPNAIITVDAGDDMVTWSGKAAQLAPTVVNNDPAQPTLSYLWSADPDDGVSFDPGAEVEAPTVTITKAPGDKTVVSLELTVTPEGSYPLTDSMKIDVYETGCLAAKITGAVVFNNTDFNTDCTTDLEDFAEVALTWLVDYELTEPAEKP